MLQYDVKQGTDEWLKLRLGVPTASNFDRILTPAGKKSSQAIEYANELVAELITGNMQEFYYSEAMARGNELEPFAVSAYEYEKKTGTKEIGFVTTDDGRIGCSPDRFIKKDGLLEIKCPLQKGHLKNLLAEDIDKKYIPQVQGQMWLCDRQWCDFMSYHPHIPHCITRIERDDGYISLLEEAVYEMIDDMDTKILRLAEKNIEFAINVNLIKGSENECKAG